MAGNRVVRANAFCVVHIQRQNSSHSQGEKPSQIHPEKPAVSEIKKRIEDLLKSAIAIGPIPGRNMDSKYYLEEKIPKLFKELEKNQELTSQEKIDCIGHIFRKESDYQDTHYDRTTQIGLVFLDFFPDKINLYFDLLSNLMEDKQHAEAIVKLFTIRDIFNMNFAEIAADTLKGEKNIILMIDFLKKLEQKGVSIDEIKKIFDVQKKTSYFDLFLKQQQNLAVYQKLFASGYLAESDYKKEEMFKFICSLDRKQQITAFAEALDKSTSLGKFFWKKRGKIGPSLNKGTLKIIKSKLEVLDPNNSALLPPPQQYKFPSLWKTSVGTQYSITENSNNAKKLDHGL